MLPQDQQLFVAHLHQKSQVACSLPYNACLHQLAALTRSLPAGDPCTRDTSGGIGQLERPIDAVAASAMSAGLRL